MKRHIFNYTKLKTQSGFYLVVKNPRITAQGETADLAMENLKKSIKEYLSENHKWGRVIIQEISIY